MENLETYGVHELKISELESTSGGSIIAAFLIGVFVGVMIALID